MNESIAVTMTGDSIQITAEPCRGGVLLDKSALLALVGLFVGNRPVFFRRENKPTATEAQAINWLNEMAQHFGVSAYVEARDCPECGRLVNDLGLCGQCADEKAGLR